MITNLNNIPKNDIVKFYIIIGLLLFYYFNFFNNNWIVIPIFIIISSLLLKSNPLTFPIKKNIKYKRKL